ncbi:hypothetical protein [Xanthomonas vesicatoria]|uniref:Uncharacterized protein n=1 Tax=Xanthomonas vesicatoria TaxID=56460 RepID=A0ABS8L4A3_9XANT|nr:hypothetical protein [Xanthomonas vesicatoria]APO93354.1 hypothetical protein BI313_00920 [Xanthomonas vesicatoria]MCC8620563.1 hypothetical protein [Xanthomonas vesicatoria]MDG4491618.1 hypothetical protein [Xanthomonas vesicatoria]
MGYLNPLLKLPAGQALKALPPSERAHLEALMRELRDQANTEAEKAWSKRKGPMAAYWRAVSTYARHIAHLLSRQAAGVTAPKSENANG